MFFPRNFEWKKLKFWKERWVLLAIFFWLSGVATSIAVSYIFLTRRVPFSLYGLDNGFNSLWQRTSNTDQQINALFQKIADVSQQRTPQTQRPDYVSETALEEMVHAYLLEKHAIRAGSSMSIRPFGSGANDLRSFPIPVDIWEQYPKHQLFWQDEGMWRLDMNEPDKKTNGGGIYTWYGLGISIRIHSEIPPLESERLPSQCDTEIDPQGTARAVAYFQSIFPEDDWTNPCANIQNNKIFAEKSDYDHLNIRMYLYRPKKKQSNSGIFGYPIASALIMREGGSSGFQGAIIEWMLIPERQYDEAYLTDTQRATATQHIDRLIKEFEDRATLVSPMCFYECAY